MTRDKTELVQGAGNSYGSGTLLFAGIVALFNAECVHCWALECWVLYDNSSRQHVGVARPIVFIAAV